MDEPRVAVFGAGRVGSALALALDRAGWPVRAIWSRTPSRARQLRAKLGTGRACSDPVRAVALADVALLVVPDDAIAPFAGVLERANWEGRTAIHHSGVLRAEVLAPLARAGAATAALHPLVTIARAPETGRDARRALRGVRWVAGGDTAAIALADRIVKALGGKRLDLAPDGRSLYHAAAVVASNYYVALADEACTLLEAAGVPREETLPALLPLIRGTLDNLGEAAGRGEPASAALTGPISRGDVASVRRHLSALDAGRGNAQSASLYRLFARRCLRLAKSQGLDTATVKRLARALADPPA